MSYNSGRGDKMRRNSYRFLGNANNMEVHDLDNEQTGANECQIDEIIKAGNARKFNPDTLQTAKDRGYDNCAYCLGGSRR